MKYATLAALCFLASLSSFAQRMPFFMHHVTNPYVYNPAFAGYDKHTVFYLTHREQWFGIEGAPSSSSLVFHTPGGQVNPFSYGADITNDRIGVLNNTQFRATVAYLVPFGVKSEHYLRFGMAAGAFSQGFDLSEIATEDDLLLQEAGNRQTVLDGRFGVQYHMNKLNLGIALPHIFGTPTLQADARQPFTLVPLRRIIASAGYDIALAADGSLSFEPTLTYHFSQEIANQLSAFGLLKVKEAFWVGGGYQQQEGIGGIMGFKAKSLKFSYAYGFGGNALASASIGTHEAQLALVIGKRQEIVKRKPRLSTTVNGERIPEAAIQAAKKEEKKEEKQSRKQEEAVPDRKKANPVTTPAKPAPDTSAPARNAVPADRQPASVPAQEQTQPINYQKLSFENLEKNANGVAKLKETPAKPNTQPAVAPEGTTPARESKVVKVAASKENTHPLSLPVGKYIIVGTFSQEGNARRLMQQLVAEGYDANIGYHAEKNFYYTHIVSGADLELLKTKLQDIQQNTRFKSAWILSVE